MNMIIVIVITAAASFAGFWVYRRWARSGVMLDHPGPRSSHSATTPTGAGVVIVAVVLMAVLLLPEVRPEHTVALLLAATLGMLGFLDDRKGLPVGLRLLVQAGLVCLFLYLNRYMLPARECGLWFQISFALGALALLLWLINLFNFMDGIDGIASLQACFLSVAYLMIFSLDAAGMPLVPLAVSTAIFLIFNRAPATLFMGDSGSLFIGGVLALFGALLVISDQAALPVVLILWGSFAADATVTLVRRCWRREMPWRAHKEHFYQRLSQSLQNHSKVANLYTAINILWLLPLALLAYFWPQYGNMVLVAAYLPLVIAVTCYKC